MLVVDRLLFAHERSELSVQMSGNGKGTVQDYGGRGGRESLQNKNPLLFFTFEKTTVPSDH